MSYLYEVSYMQQRLGDDLVDLEIEHIDKIIAKIENSNKNKELAQVELNLWRKIRTLALAGRRTGNGFTALGDMLAALNLPYYSPDVVREVMKTKMRAELDCTIDMAILRGTFEGWDSKKEIGFSEPSVIGIRNSSWQGQNDFFQMLIDEFPEQTMRMMKYGRRNVSWSTVAPTGTVSLMTQTTSGLEPLFKAFYIRRKKVNPSDNGVRVDFIDDMGDKWQEYPILHPKFKQWIKTYLVQNVEFKSGALKGYRLVPRDVDMDLMEELTTYLTKDKVEEFFKLSPWYGSQAEDISWQERIEINAIIQRYTSNAISCTINLPKDISKEVVHNIYFEAWKAGLKGITIYREGSRSGVLVTETKHITTEDQFGYNDAIKRPRELEADYHYVMANGKEYAVVVGKLNGNPYEIFAFPSPIYKEELKGKIIKVESGVYRFESVNYNIENLQLTHPDEKLVTRSASLMLRHGVHPKHVVTQVEKAETYISSFPKAVARVLKLYIPNEEIKGEICPSCSQPTMVREEGCKKCVNCGYSRC
jgi:ribonucleoside-diphosphate reductase alpha chain